MAAPGEFELARRVAVRMMETRAFAKDIEEEDPTMVKYISDLRRLNELGMITSNSQSGKRSTFAHYQTGKRVDLVERAYCYGFVDAAVADAVIQWMWDKTDKYVTRAIDVEAVARGDTELYAVLSDFGRIGVTRSECDGAASWPTRASAVVMPHDYKCNYGRWVYPEQRGAPATADGEEAIKHVGPYLAHPVPRSAVCLLCVDMRLGRRADARDGIFTQLEAALNATRTGPSRPSRPSRPGWRGTPSRPRPRSSRPSRPSSAGRSASRSGSSATRSRSASARRPPARPSRPTGRRSRSRGARSRS